MTINIYPAKEPHAPVRIVCDVSGAFILRDLAQMALRSEHSVSTPEYDSTGEQYTVELVFVKDPADMPEPFRDYDLPQNMWEALNAELPLRPIKDEEGYDRAIKMLDLLVSKFGRENGLSVDEHDYLGTLGALVYHWEEIHYPIRQP